MTILHATRPATKSTRVLFSPNRIGHLFNPHFGFGISFPERDRRAGYTAADLAWASANLNASADASDEAWEEELSYRTMTVSAYEDFITDLQVAEHDRYAQCDEAELAELRTSSEMMAAAQSNINRPATAIWTQIDGVLRDVTPAKPQTRHQVAVAARRAAQV